MIDSLRLLTFNLYRPVNDDEINNIEEKMGVKFPNVYKELLRYTNGFITDDGIVIFGTDDIIERNLTYEVAEYAEGYVAVGGNSGGSFFLMEVNESTTELLQVGCGDMNPENATLVTTDFMKWISEGAINIELIDSQNEKEKCKKLYDLILIKPPKNGAKDLKEIKELFNIKKGLFDLLKGSKQLPFVLTTGISLETATSNFEKLGEISEILEIRPVDNYNS